MGVSLLWQWDVTATLHSSRLSCRVYVAHYWCHSGLILLASNPVAFTLFQFTHSFFYFTSQYLWFIIFRTRPRLVSMTAEVAAGCSCKILLCTLLIFSVSLPPASLIMEGSAVFPLCLAPSRLHTKITSCFQILAGCYHISLVIFCFFSWFHVPTLLCPLSKVFSHVTSAGGTSLAYKNVLPVQYLYLPVHGDYPHIQCSSS